MRTNESHSIITTLAMLGVAKGDIHEQAWIALADQIDRLCETGRTAESSLDDAAYAVAKADNAYGQALLDDLTGDYWLVVGARSAICEALAA